MAGFDAPYVVGYDCHGLPIELQVDRELGPKKREMSVADFCRACRAYAERFVGTMSEQFQRLGILGTWDEPYLTMNFKYQAAIARAFGKFVEQGLVYKGKKPVHWCIHCRTALAEAEVEYEDHTSPSIYVEFPLAPESAGELAARVPALAGRDVSVLIWTTTPWTIPSNLAIAFHPEFDYAAYDVDGRRRHRRRSAGAEGRGGRRQDVRRAGRANEGRLSSNASDSSIRSTRATRSACSATYVTLDAGTGAVHTAPGHGADDFSTGMRYGLEIYAPIGPAGHFLDTVELFGGQRVFDANPNVEEALKERGRLWHRETFSHQYPHCWRCHNPVIFLATSQWFIRPRWHRLQDTGPRAQGDNDAARGGARRDRSRGEVDSRAGATTASTTWSRTGPTGASRGSAPGACRFRRSTARRAARRSITPALVEQGRRRCSSSTAPTPGTSGRPRSSCPTGLTCPTCGGTDVRARDEHPRRLVRLRFEPRGGAVGPARADVAGRHVPRRQRSASRLVPELAAGRPRHARAAAVPAGLTHGFLDRRRRHEDVEVARQHDRAAGHHQAERRRHPPAVGGDERLRAGDPGQQGDPGARRRGVPEDPQHDAVSRARTCTTSIRRPTRADWRSSRRSIATSWPDTREVGAAHAARATSDYDYGTIFQALNAFATVDLSAFYADISKDRLYTFARAVARAAVGADGDVHDGRRPDAAAGADPVVHRRRAVAATCPARARSRCTWRVFPDGGGARRRSRMRELVERWDALIAVREQVLARDRAAAQGQADRQLAAGEGRAVGDAGRAGAARALRAASCRCCSSCRRWSCGRRRPTSRPTRGATDVTIERAGGVKCERCWRYVPSGVERSRVGRPVRPLPGRAGRADPWHDDRADARPPDVDAVAPPSRLEMWLPLADRRCSIS